MTGYVYDEAHCAKCHSSGHNYWFKYIEEIFDEMGLRASKLSRSQLLQPESISRLKFIFIGEVDLSGLEKERLHEWVTCGGTLIGFATGGADDLFGIKRVKRILQADGHFTVTGAYQFNAAIQAKADPRYDYRAARLFIISDVELVEALDGSRVGSFVNAGRYETEYELIVEQRVGSGKTIFLGFDMPKTIWTMHQGRPVDRDWDGDGYYRTGDAIALGRMTDLELPYADYWLLFLEDLLTQVPQPFVHQLPPSADGELPDMLLHYGGDDECTPGIQVKASEYMKEKGLGYQMNIMQDKSGKFAISAEQYKQIKANGHDLSLHFDFFEPHYHFTEAHLREQLQQYEAAFGETPVATVNHCSMVTAGWTDQARWAAALGMKGDNTRIHSFFPPMNPINLFGCGFGTVYPHFVYDDHKHGNDKIEYVYIPILLFEPRIYDQSRELDIARIRDAIERAAHFRWTLNVFLHPIYLVDPKETVHCWPAVEEILRFIEERQYRVLHYSTNELCLWWFDRAATSVHLDSTSRGDSSSLTFTVTTPSSQGVYVKLPLPDSASETASYKLDGISTQGIVQRRNAKKWLMCFVPQGSHDIEISVA